jgi:hypothetical protein
MVVSAGIVPVLLKLLSNRHFSQVKVRNDSHHRSKTITIAAIFDLILVTIMIECYQGRLDSGQPHLWVQHGFHVFLLFQRA